jgi:hypothetical protein
MTKTLGCVLAATLLAASATACSSSSDSSADYCGTLKASQSQFKNTSFAALTEDQFDQLRDKVRTLQDAAPSSIQDDWGVLGDKLDAFKGLLDDAGIKLDDLKSMQQGQIPPGIDAAKLQALAPKLQQLMGGSDLQDATSAIQKNAKSDCNITL